MTYWVRLQQYVYRGLAIILGLALILAYSPKQPTVTTPTGEAASQDNRTTVDLVVAADQLVTMDASNTVIANGAVAIDQGLIVAVGLAEEIYAQYAGREQLEGEQKILLPGLVNGHTHAAMTLLRGIADDLALMDWLNNYIFPAEVAFVDDRFVRIGTELACWEMLRGGTTTFVDMYYYPDVIADTVERCGLRAYISATVIDQRSPDAESATDGLAKARQFALGWNNRSSRITPILGPHANYTLNREQLIATRNLANDLDLNLSIHVAESPFEIQYSNTTYGAPTITFLDSIGFFDGPTIAAHVVWPNADEIAVLAAKDVGVIHNPTSNMKLASGVAPVSALLEGGVRVGLGTDGAASNNDLDMWEEMRLAAFLQKVEQMNPEALPARTVLGMATRDGAAAIGLGEQVGSLEVGKRADLIQVDFSDVHHVPTFNVMSHLVYVTDEQDVTTTIVDGRILMRDREPLTIDTERLATEARALAAEIQAELATRNAAP